MCRVDPSEESKTISVVRSSSPSAGKLEKRTRGTGGLARRCHMEGAADLEVDAPPRFANIRIVSAAVSGCANASSCSPDIVLLQAFT